MNPLNKDDIAFLSGACCLRNVYVIVFLPESPPRHARTAGWCLDEDDIPDDIDDEDLKNDPISQMDMTVRCSVSVFTVAVTFTFFGRFYSYRFHSLTTMFLTTLVPRPI